MNKYYLNIINNYFGTSYNENIKLQDILRFVSIINETDFIINIQDLSPLILESEFRIWFNKDTELGLVECKFGQCRTGYLHDTLEECLLYSISEWCKYNKYVTEIQWRRVRSNSNIKYGGYLNIDNKEILLYNIYDLDYYHLEYYEYNLKDKHDPILVMSEMHENAEILDIQNEAQWLYYEYVTKIYENPQLYNLNKN